MIVSSRRFVYIDRDTEATIPKLLINSRFPAPRTCSVRNLRENRSPISRTISLQIRSLNYWLAINVKLNGSYYVSKYNTQWRCSRKLRIIKFICLDKLTTAIYDNNGDVDLVILKYDTM